MWIANYLTILICKSLKPLRLDVKPVAFSWFLITRIGCFGGLQQEVDGIISCAEGGDQSLFVHRELFQELGGYDTRFKVCEDLDLIKRLYRKVKFRVLPQKILTSSRRFYENGTLRLLIHFGIMHFSHWLGAGPQFLYRYYGTFVR